MKEVVDRLESRADQTAHRLGRVDLLRKLRAIDGADAYVWAIRAREIKRLAAVERRSMSIEELEELMLLEELGYDYHARAYVATGDQQHFRYSRPDSEAEAKRRDLQRQLSAARSRAGFAVEEH